MSTIEKHIAKINFQLRVQAVLKALLAAIAVGVFSRVFLDSILAMTLTGLLVFGSAAYLLGLFNSFRTEAIQILHQHFPDLEFSLELLDKTPRNSAEKLQWERVNSSFKGGEIGIWYQITWPFLLALALASGVFVLSQYIPVQQSKGELTENIKDNFQPSSTLEDLPVNLLDVKVSITPPAYTALPIVNQAKLEISTIKAAEIEWRLKFSNSADVAFELVSSAGNSLSFSQDKGDFFLKDQVKNSGIYAIRGHRNDELVYESGYFPLEAKDDLAPVIQPADRELYSYHFTNDPKVMEVKARVSDDFKVREVYLVATLARGSGENVKFRENRIPVSRSNFKAEDLSVQLDLNALDFKHGDELYYYWAAIDNKMPEPNFSRSDTYFINYVDSAGLSEEELVGMAIHVMPDYFRSQRQIIIDTEKLLAAQKNLSEREFNATSNEIGYDQKMLRLRYGQYLGEEFEETAGGGPTATGHAENLLEGYEHRHDEESEAGITANVLLPSEHEEQHSEESHGQEEGGIESVLDSYLHNHEDPEANTYFEESTKGTLKAALEEMWEAELYMRLFEPEKALPYQEKALELLKKVQQKSRVYVKRTGFDPPPIKPEEKRLSGDLEEVKNRIEREQKEIFRRLEPLAAEILGLLNKDALDEQDQLLIQNFGELWTVRMNYSGMDDWSVLLLLQELKSGKIREEGKLEMFEKIYPLIPKSEGLNASYLKQRKLEKAFWSRLK
ncbi:hypothetical protein [Algoriphagus halophytocola]|uniref:Tryptophan-rich sensory protein n=1 Tax=Algoriphagus halophytocola TaxID=2991499 RepID=A0ABY6MJN7_9BACT|nr:hypothetical protein [Algoriphagus sp. TR-M5]UZD23985.1 hypothetical protein OM944_05690 [Algoriphagus sp. TR-M5]